MTDILSKLGIDQTMFLDILVIVVLVLILLIFVILVMNARMYRRYDFFMRGKDAETMEDMIVEMYERMQVIEDQAMNNKDRMKLAQFGVVNAYQRTGLVKYNAFSGMGGQSSFCLALLNQSNSGIILNAMHSRTNCYLYIKEVKNGEPESELGKEEREALKRAMGK